jgi:hypothetical protein
MVANRVWEETESALDVAPAALPAPILRSRAAMTEMRHTTATNGAAPECSIERPFTRLDLMLSRLPGPFTGGTPT